MSAFSHQHNEQVKFSTISQVRVMEEEIQLKIFIMAKTNLSLFYSTNLKVATQQRIDSQLRVDTQQRIDSWQRIDSRMCAESQSRDSFHQCKMYRNSRFALFMNRLSTIFHARFACIFATRRRRRMLLGGDAVAAVVV